MNFSEAMQRLEQGAKVRQMHWAKGRYIKRSDLNSIVDDQNMRWMPWGNELLATWEVVQEK